ACTPRRLPGLHHLGGAPTDFRQIIVGTKQLAAEPETIGTGGQPGWYVSGTYPTYRVHAYVFRQHRAYCLQEFGTIGGGRKKLQFSGAGANRRERFSWSRDARHHFHAEIHSSANHFRVAVGGNDEAAAGCMSAVHGILVEHRTS